VLRHVQPSPSFSLHVWRWDSQCDVTVWHHITSFCTSVNSWTFWSCKVLRSPDGQNQLLDKAVTIVTIITTITIQSTMFLWTPTAQFRSLAKLIYPHNSLKVGRWPMTGIRSVHSTPVTDFGRKNKENSALQTSVSLCVNTVTVSRPPRHSVTFWTQSPSLYSNCITSSSAELRTFCCPTVSLLSRLQSEAVSTVRLSSSHQSPIPPQQPCLHVTPSTVIFTVSHKPAHAVLSVTPEYSELA